VIITEIHANTFGSRTIVISNVAIVPKKGNSQEPVNQSNKQHSSANDIRFCSLAKHEGDAVGQ